MQGAARTLECSKPAMAGSYENTTSQASKQLVKHQHSRAAEASCWTMQSATMLTQSNKCVRCAEHMTKIKHPSACPAQTLDQAGRTCRKPLAGNDKCALALSTCRTAWLHMLLLSTLSTSACTTSKRMHANKAAQHCCKHKGMQANNAAQAAIGCCASATYLHHAVQCLCASAGTVS